MLLWKDVNDNDTVIIGDKATYSSSVSGKMKERYTGWSSIHIDAIGDLFGSDVADAVELLNQQPAGTFVDVQLIVLRVDGEDVSGCEAAKLCLDDAARSIGKSRDGIRHNMQEVTKWMEDIGV